MALIKCPECNTEVSDRAEKCIKCGFPLARYAPVKCPECGGEVPYGAVTCGRCGFPMKGRIGTSFVINNATKYSNDLVLQPHKELDTEHEQGKVSSESDDGDTWAGLSDKWAWTLAFFPVMYLVLVSLLAMITSTLGVDGGRVESSIYIVIGCVLIYIFYYLDKKEVRKKESNDLEEDGGNWLYIFFLGITCGIFVLIYLPIYLFKRASLTRKKYGYAITSCVCYLMFVVLVIFLRCADIDKSMNSAKTSTQQNPSESTQNSAPVPTESAKSPAALVPTGYKIIQEDKGDLNKDDLEDYIFVIAEKQDESRRGIVIAFNNGEHYENILESRNIFSYDKDVVSYVPELKIVIKKGVFDIKVWERCGGGMVCREYKYRFRYQNSDFELIGYDYTEYGVHSGGIGILGKISVNLLSNKIQTKVNKAEDGSSDEFNETWNDIVIREPIKLRRMVSFGYEDNVMTYISKK